MKNLKYIAFFLIISLAACGIKADECTGTGCGSRVDITEQINVNTFSQSVVTSEGLARYLWYTDFGFACTEHDALITFELILNERNKLVETDVQLWVLTGGQIDPLTLTPVQRTTETEFFEFHSFRLFDAIASCDANVRLRLQIDFESFGSSQLNESYITELLEDGGFMTINFTEATD